MTILMYNRKKKISFEERFRKLGHKFWQLEEVLKEYPYSVEEKLCKINFDNNVTHNFDGRFVDTPNVWLSYETAKHRLIFLERRLANDEKFKIPYTQFMTKYERLGIMKYINVNENNIIDANTVIYRITL